MKDLTKDSPAKGSDWTRLLTDPDLVSHLGKLLQTYREVSPEKREQALLTAMRKIKESAVSARAAAASASGSPVAAPVKSAALPHPEPIAATPPFEPDLFAAQAAQDRRLGRQRKLGKLGLELAAAEHALQLAEERANGQRALAEAVRHEAAGDHRCVIDRRRARISGECSFGWLPLGSFVWPTRGAVSNPPWRGLPGPLTWT